MRTIPTCITAFFMLLCIIIPISAGCHTASSKTGSCKGFACVGDPIDSGSGNLYEDYTDYEGDGPFGLVFKRAYNSSIAGEATSPDGASENLGRGWTTNVDRHVFVRLTALPPGKKKPGPCMINGVAYFCPPPNLALEQPYEMEAIVWNADGSQEEFIDLVLNGPIKAGKFFKNEPRTQGKFSVTGVSATHVPTGFLYTRDDGTQERFDADGKLLSVSDGDGLLQQYHYGMDGRLNYVSGPFGRRLTFGYDDKGRVKTLTNPAGKIFRYQYDTANNLSSVEFPDHSRIRYVYADKHYPNALTSIVDQDGKRYVAWSYDSQGRAVTSALADGTDQVRIAYNADGSADIYEKGFAPRHLTFKTINYSHQMATSSAPCKTCNIKSINYDKNGFISSETDFQGHITRYTNDVYGNELTSKADATNKDSKTLMTSWDANHERPTAMRTGNDKMKMHYDTHGRLTEMAGLSSEDKKIHQIKFKYNNQGLLNEEIDSHGNTIRYSYDKHGNITKIISSDGAGRQMPVHDIEGHTLKEIDGSGGETDWKYDVMGRIISEKNKGIVTHYKYDADGQMVRIYQSKHAYIAYHYNIAHRLVSMSDNEGDLVVFKYDLRGTPIGERVYNKYQMTMAPSEVLKRFNGVLSN